MFCKTQKHKSKYYIQVWIIFKLVSHYQLQLLYFKNWQKQKIWYENSSKFWNDQIEA